MLNLNDTRIVRTKQEDVAAGVLIPEEGMALVAVMQQGRRVVQPSTGASGEVFTGVSFHRFAPPALYPVVEMVEVGADGSIVASQVPAAGQLAVFINGEALTVVTAAPASDAEVQYTGTATLRTDVGNAQAVAKLQYLYAPSAVQARAILGDAPVGGLGVGEIASVGALKDADLSTSFFVASADWTNAQFVKLAANGMFAPAAAADAIPNVLVRNVPGAGSPFLGLTILVA